MICDSQKPVVEFLSSPKNHDGSAVQQIDTHLSHIFLTKNRAYKLKRAVRYDFVDFSKVSLRRAACEREVEINRRTAPEIYMGVIPIYCSEGGAAWRGESEPADWVVEMARFDADQQFDVLAAGGKLDASLIKPLAEKLARFHASAEIDRSFRPGGGIPALIDQISTTLHEHEIGSVRERDIARWTALAFEEYEKHSAFLTSRRRHGWVRLCHGDLHLANICLFKGEPTPFDAIEFNDEIASIDVLYDLAFLSMDLINHNRGELANTLINRYLSITRDYRGAGLLKLFHTMRAGVRAMVLSLPTQPEKRKRLAERYLDLALEFLIGGEAPRLIAVGGYSATGKSTLAGELALKINGRAGAVLLRSDVVRKRMLDQQPEDRLEAVGYAQAHTASVYRRLLKDARRVLHGGQSVIVDATFLEQDYHSSIEAMAKRIGVRFDGLWLSAPRDVLTDRISQRKNGASDATDSVLEKQFEKEIDAGNWTTVDASGSPHETLHHAASALNLAD